MLQGTALRHAKWRELTPDETAAAVTELRALASGRADQLAECAGLLIGAAEGTGRAALYDRAAELLIQAGGDGGLLPR